MGQAFLPKAVTLAGENGAQVFSETMMFPGGPTLALPEGLSFPPKWVIGIMTAGPEFNGTAISFLIDMEANLSIAMQTANMASQPVSLSGKTVSLGPGGASKFGLGEWYILAVG